MRLRGVAWALLVLAVRPLGLLRIAGIEPTLRGDSVVAVTISIDPRGATTFTARDADTGDAHPVVVAWSEDGEAAIERDDAR